MTTFAESFGHLFEVAVDCGIARAWHAARALSDEQAAPLRAWTPAGLVAWLDKRHSPTAPDGALRRERHDAVLHLFAQGHRIGQTVGRSILAAVRGPGSSGDIRVAGWWAPADVALGEVLQEGLADRFRACWGLPPAVVLDDLVRTGQPAHADLLALLSVDLGGRVAHHLVAVETSLRLVGAPSRRLAVAEHEGVDVIPPVGATDLQTREVALLGQYLMRRNAFAGVRVDALDPGTLPIDPDLASFLVGFHGTDRPAYKLAQASAYATAAARLLVRQGRLAAETLQVYAVAATNLGHAGLKAVPRAVPSGLAFDRMDDLARCYRRLAAGDNRSLEEVAERVRARALQLHSKSSPDGQRLVRSLLAVDPATPASQSFVDVERVEGFYGPAATFTPEEASLWFRTDDPTIAKLLGGDPWERVRRHVPAGDAVTLRDVHGACVSAAVAGAPRGQVTPVLLSGCPGIGKTTALRKLLTSAEHGGFLLLYLSPRTTVNGDVFAKYARDSRTGGRPEILCLTTDSRLIGGYREKTQKKTSTCVRYAGVTGLSIPPRSGMPVFLDDLEAAEIAERYGTNPHLARRLNQDETEVLDLFGPGVLKTLATAIRHAAGTGKHPRIAAACSIQSHRRVRGRSTLESLRHLFLHPADRGAGRKERERFATRCPSVVVMIDEIAGDSAGASCFWEIHERLHEEFIRPFGDASPFTVVLVAADASLGDPRVMRDHLAAGNDQARKVYVVDASQRPPVTVEAFPNIRHVQGAFRPAGPTLAVRADSFPASSLELRQRIDVRPLADQERPEERVCDVLLDEIRAALRRVRHAEESGEASVRGQVVAFVQDRRAVRALADALPADPVLLDAGIRVPRAAIATLSSDSHAANRQQFLEPATRDAFEVILMTSSGARGIDLPLATDLIAVLPSFHVEAQFMEIVQFAYRGRGVSEGRGTRIDGDRLARRLTFVIVRPTEALGEDRTERRWWQQARVLDLATVVLLLRGALRSRIQGSVAWCGRNLAVIPVGATGEDEVGEILLDDAQRFLKAAEEEVVMGDADGKGALVAAQEGVAKIFSSPEFALRELAAGAQDFFVTRGVVPAMEARDLVDAVPLLAPQEAAYGPLILSMRETLAEYTRLDLSDPARRKALQKLLGVLGPIARERGGTEVARTARNLRSVLEAARDLDEDHAFVRRAQGRHAEVCLLLPQCLAQASGRGRAGEKWFTALRVARAGLLESAEYYPLFPHYGDEPFLLVARRAADVEQATALFRDGLLLARDLNLVNALLLADSAKGAPGLPNAG